MERKFNFIDEKWVITNVGMASLNDVFTNDRIRTVGSTTTENLCLNKLCIAIGQAANDFDTIDDIAEAGIEKVRENIIRYLDQHHDDFWLYGDRPFLQFPVLLNYDPDMYRVKFKMNSLDENAASGNNGIYVDSQVKNEYDDADKANLLLVNIGSPVKAKPSPLYRTKKEGKGDDKRIHVILSGNAGYVKAAAIKKEKLCSGDNMCGGLFNDKLHGFVTGSSMMETVFANILSNEEIDELVENSHVVSKGLPPWEINGMNEEHGYAKTYYAYLLPMNRFMLFDDGNEDCLMTEGIQYCTVSGKEIKYDFMFSQPDIFVYNEKIKSKNEDECLYRRAAVRPRQSESVMFSMHPYVESRRGNKSDIYNFMINHSKALLETAFGKDQNAWKHYGIEYMGTEYEVKSGSMYRVGYVEKRFGFGTKIARDDDRMASISAFIGDPDFNLKEPKDNHACALMNLAVYRLKMFYKEYSDDSLFNQDAFRQRCRCLLRDAEERAVNQDFDMDSELDEFRKNVNKLALEEIGLDNPHDRGRKMEIAYNVGIML